MLCVRISCKKHSSKIVAGFDCFRELENHSHQRRDHRSKGLSTKRQSDPQATRAIKHDRTAAKYRIAMLSGENRALALTTASTTMECPK